MPSEVKIKSMSKYLSQRLQKVLTVTMLWTRKWYKFDFSSLCSNGLVNLNTSREVKKFRLEIEPINISDAGKLVKGIFWTQNLKGNSLFNDRENDDADYMFRSYKNCYYSSSEPVTDEEDEL